MSDKNSHLTGGILFGLIIEARKARKRVRSTKLNYVETDKSDGLNEDDMMLSFIEIFTGESLLKPKGTSFKKNVSDYKKCVTNTTTYLTFDQHIKISSIPSIRDFKKTVANYLSWEVSQLLKNKEEDSSKKV